MTYDGTQQFYSSDPFKNLQLIEYGRDPNSQISSASETGTTYVDKSGNKIIKIVGKDSNGNVVTKQYQLMDIANEINVPKLQQISGFDGQQIHLDKLTQESIGSSMFHAQNYNLDEIEKAINLLLQNQAITTNNQNKIIDFFNGLSQEEITQISINLSTAIEKDFYKKSDVDIKINNLERELENIQSKIQYKPNAGGVFPPSYTGDKASNIDINDDITDYKTSVKIDELNNNIIKEGD
ncbi:hypothetical protein M5C72_02800 [Companilactobacillus allii]|uniref:Uncharacterized protein n=1 Tax=Companilactobacillus allii TaxID=1847728 RepID=A0A1P8Q2I9_9LACO|nr:hypothetical protein [Companilactobacillus allii]APX72092.1 hypothetical protein BTM29_05720 [Companilactobacillus allii]USQ69184.1 hypothetical protein M5C72_02800 [Companilactobacillus allii]